ncbi:glycoside hydrolase family 2 protein [Vibrio sp. SCSIO 43132]|uniref:glycoside hydrolase family 2 protein n=1 Tax=Vibrio sp. SCSIO 43132 TaxID=2779363 RepID=UPI001CA95791|nr:glycoside hydrolase family 2 TIM barrel-domain containing protein [Vibrio sp. SCSIO 43132]UAB71025.1 glycoside hydrolase family 2 protein [Vibrio sp. SCSIO 43132]
MINSTILNSDWLFCENHYCDLDISKIPSVKTVQIPHSSVELPMNYFSEKSLHQDFTYQQTLSITDSDLSKTQYLYFEGVMCDAKVYVNGELAGLHSDGYTPFEVLITPYLNRGDNRITVTLSGKENPSIPPFGGQIDYLCFPGIYRDVYLRTYSSCRVFNVKAESLNILTSPTLKLDVYLESFLNEGSSGTLDVIISDKNGEVIKQVVKDVGRFYGESFSTLLINDLKGIVLWDIDNPELYKIEVRLIDEHSRDTFEFRHGFRDIQFTTEGFFLNGKRLKLIGANRHQSYPYIGYAMGQSGQELDADILRFEFGFNTVRTSHYPQSPYFLNRCDEIGLLVFEEIPGWQHIGDKDWQSKAVDNVKAMIQRDWNHPSIILWGVRINESDDNFDFYEKTNQQAKALDSTRQTGGVRCSMKGDFQEDVFTFNDFVLGDTNEPLRKPFDSHGKDYDIPYLVTEYNGHMYPTKRVDNENWQVEHVTRHLRVLNEAHSNDNISGVITWCLSDYNTHKEFGSGDMICHHGVSDVFRNPKFAAYVYSSQINPSKKAVMEPVSYWTVGERCAAGVLPLIILTNCDCVEVTLQNGVKSKFYPAKEQYPHLPYPPVIIEAESGDDLFGKYSWGGGWQDVTFTGYFQGEAVSERKFSASKIPSDIKINVQKSQLNENCRDTARVLIEAIDTSGNILPYFSDFLTLEVSDNLEVIGPKKIILEAGTTGFWVEAKDAGMAVLEIESHKFGRREVVFNVVEQK